MFEDVICRNGEVICFKHHIFANWDPSQFVSLREMPKICEISNKQSRRFRIPLYRLLHLCRLWAIVPARLQASIVATAKLNFCVRNGNRWTLCVWITDLCQHWAIVPARLQASIVATAKLNFCVRNGNRWTLCVWNTDWEAGSYRFFIPCRKPEQKEM